MAQLSLSMLHQNKKTNHGSSFYLSKTEGLGMASIRAANCMELPVGRMASRLAVYLLFPSVLIPCSLKRDFIPQRVADFIHGSAVIKCESGSISPPSDDFYLRFSAIVLKSD